MSDDTPTRPYEPADDESRTEILPAQHGELEPERTSASSRKRLIVTLAIVGGGLLVALVIVLATLLTRPAGTTAPTATPTPAASSEGTPIPSSPPSTTPDPEDSTEPAPPATPPTAAVTEFFAWDDEVDCSGDVAVPISFQWTATGERLWFGVGTEDAQAEPYGEYPLSHTLDIDYQCGQPNGSQIYTVTVQAADGTTASSTVTVTEAALVVPE